MVSTCLRSYVAAAVHRTASSSGRPFIQALPPRRAADAIQEHGGVNMLSTLHMLSTLAGGG